MIKKIMIFMILSLTIIYIPSITTQAKYDDTLLDYPIDELNNLTLNQVFEDNNIFNIVSLNVVQLYNFNNLIPYKMIANTTNTMHYLEYNLKNYVSTNDYIYNNITLNNVNGLSLFIRNYIFNGSSYLRDDYLNTLELGNYSFKKQIPSYYDNTDLFYRVMLYDNASTFIGNNNKSITFTPNIYVNMSNLGINNLTKEQMDYYYNIYQSYNDIDNLELNDEYSGYMETIWNTFVNLTKNTNKIISFATEPITFSIPEIEYDDEGDIVERAIVSAVNWVIGGLNTFGLKNYTVLEIIITGWIVLLPMYLIKKFIPLL